MPKKKSEFLEIPEYLFDKRGKGQIIEGRKIRGYKGSTRLPGWTPEEWKFCTLPEQKNATAQYLTNLHTLQARGRTQFEDTDLESTRGLDPDGGDITLKELQARKKATSPSIAVARIAQRFGPGMKVDTKSGRPQGDYWETTAIS